MTTSLHYAIESEPRRVRDIPLRLRPREELDRIGARHVSDDVLLAVLLRSGTRGMNVIQLARHLLQEYGSLTAIASASVDELAHHKGMGRVKAQVLTAALELASRLGEESVPKRHRIQTPEDVAAVLRNRTRSLDTEVFWVLHLDAKNQLKGAPAEVTRGLLDASLVHPREVFRQAISQRCAAIILAHNHPSGDPTPSAEDLDLTRRIGAAGDLVGVGVMDHVIVGAGRWTSLLDEGLMGVVG